MVRTLVNRREPKVPRARSNQYPAISNLGSSFSVITHSRSSARALDDAAVNGNRAGYDEAEPAGAATSSIASTHVDVFGGVGMRLLGIYPHGQYSIPACFREWQEIGEPPLQRSIRHTHCRMRLWLRIICAFGLSHRH